MTDDLQEANEVLKSQLIKALGLARDMRAIGHPYEQWQSHWAQIGGALLDLELEVFADDEEGDE